MSFRFSFVILIIMLIAGAVSTAFANQNVTIQGRLLEADLTPITANSVQFVVQVRSSGAEDCLLYEETQTLNLNTTQGAFALVLGTGTRSNATIDGGNSLEKVFSNNGTLSLTAATTPCANASTSYTPGVSSTRIVNVTYNDGTGWDTIPAIPLSWVPQAMYAQDAGMLGGVSATSYVLQSQFPTCSSGDFLTKTASGTFICASAAASLGIIESVSSTNSYITATTSGTDVYLTANLGTAALYNIGTTSGSIPLLTSSGTFAASVLPSNILTSATVFAGDLSGSPSSLTITAVSGKPAAQIATSVNDTQAATATATASTIVKRDGAGGISVTGLSLNNLYLYNAANYLQLRASTSLSSNYTLTFPAALGSSGTVLSTDGAGQLAWVSTLPSYSGDVTSTSGTSTLTLSNSGVVSGTYGKVSVDLKGRVTSGNPLSATDVITALGYTPANSATAANGSLLAANNLSDLISSATARTNLGLGATSVLDFIDLGTTFASGTLAAARLPAYSGDVMSVSGSAYLTLANSGVTSATYTKVLVNAKGIITSGSTINSSDVVTALGYTPANSATVAAVSLLKANNLSDLTSATVARTNLELGATSVLNFIDLGSDFASGTLAAARLPAYSGDVTSVSGSAYLTLANSGVTSATYTKVSVNAKGIVTSGSAINSSDVVTALGYTPANSATVAAVSLLKTNNLSDLASATVARTNLELGATSVLDFIDLGTAFASGTIAAARLPGYSGDVTSVSGSAYLTLANSGVTSATYTKVSVNAKGIITSGSTITNADVVSALGYTPANSATVAAVSLLKANNLSDLTSATVARTNLELGATSVLNFIDLGSDFASGTLSAARLPAYSGDVTSVSGSAYLTLVNTGVTSATYTKVSVNAKGIITSGSAITNSDVVTALGYTPANSATIGITSLNGSSSSTQIFALGSFGTTPGVSTSLLGVHTLHFPLASTNGVTAGLLSNADYASFANKITSSAASISETLGYTPANSATVLAPSLLKANNLSDVVSATVARTNLELGTAAVLNVGVAANNIVQLDSSARIPAIDASLVTSVTRNNIAAAAANHVVINSSSGTLTSEASLAISRGGTAATSFVANALIMTNGTGTAFTSATCSGGEILRWNAVSGSWACTSVLAAISATAVVNNGNSLGASVTIGTIDNHEFNLKTNNTLRLHVANSGNIGIGLGSNIAASTTLQVGGPVTPQTDNSITLGSATFRWSTVHAGTGLIQTSDGREKNHIEPSNLGLEFISEIKPVSYHWKKGSDHSKHYGFIAQDLEKILRKYTQTPAMVDHDKETGRYGIRYTELISPLVKSVQELNGKLVRENSQLQSQVNQLKEENNSIKQYICLKDPSAVFCNRQ